MLLMTFYVTVEYRKLTHRSKKSTQEHIWNGVYETWEQACSSAQDLGGVFQSEHWKDRIIGQLIDYRKSCSKYDVALPPRPNNLPWVCATTNPESIIDYGGSSGWSYDYLLRTLADHSISSYIIVELEEIAQTMKQSIYHKDSPVEYKTSKDSLDRCDLFYANSVLQYFESNQPMLRVVEETMPTYILLDDLVAKGKSDYFSTQNYWGTSIPYRFLGLQQLLLDLESVGYKKLIIAPYMSPIKGMIKPFPMENFPEIYKLQYSLSILLKKERTSEINQ